MTTALFLGLDCSTQALKASLLSNTLSVLSELEVRFDRDVSHYGTQGGTLQGPIGSGIVYSPVMMVVEAMDLLFEKIKMAKWPVQDIRGVGAAGQQHASVYWSYQASSLLNTMDAAYSMASQLQDAFSRKEIPNWQDSSTLNECKQLEESVGGASNLAQLTGSRAHTRFTGPQIMRFKANESEAYEKTARISLVSSFITSLLCLDGEIKNIDESDACGMNIWKMNTPNRGWDHDILQTIAGGKAGSSQELKEKLGEVETDGGKVVGHIGHWFVKRYNFHPSCIVCPGTGDNPATFLALSMRPMEGLISLGTSDTVLVSTSIYTPDPDYHAFFHPAQIATIAAADDGDKKRYFNMLVYKNGSLTREYIRDKYFHSSWDEFNKAVESSKPKSADDPPSHTGFWWLKPEILPANASGVHKYIYSPRSSTSSSSSSILSKAEKVDEFQPTSLNAIAILESQMFNYRSRSSAILGNAKLSRVYATGGAALNPVICSVMADVLGCEVCKPVEYQVDTKQWKNADWNVCSMAMAYKAAWSWYRFSAKDKDEKLIDYDSFIRQCNVKKSKGHYLLQNNTQVNDGSNVNVIEEGVAVIARPDQARSQAYDHSLERWKALEKRALEESRVNLKLQ